MICTIRLSGLASLSCHRNIQILSEMYNKRKLVLCYYDVNKYMKRNQLFNT